MTTPMREKMIAQVAKQRGDIRKMDPQKIAGNTGMKFENGVFQVDFYGEPYTISFPDLEVRFAKTNKVCGLNRSAMFFFYMLTADGSPVVGKWVAFRDLPGGTFYHQAYQGYSGDRLAKAIDNHTHVFERAAKQLNGEKLDIGNAAFAFQALPRVRVAAVYNEGDEDFPATANVLFDASASNYLPTDALGGLGSALVDRLTGIESKDDQED